MYGQFIRCPNPAALIQQTHCLLQENVTLASTDSAISIHSFIAYTLFSCLHCCLFARKQNIALFLRVGYRLLQQFRIYDKLELLLFAVHSLIPPLLYKSWGRQCAGHSLGTSHVLYKSLQNVACFFLMAGVQWVGIVCALYGERRVFVCFTSVGWLSLSAPTVRGANSDCLGEVRVCSLMWPPMDFLVD